MLYKSDIDKISVTFWINCKDRSPNEITSQLDIQPSKVEIKGEFKTLGKGKHLRKLEIKNNRWILESPLPQEVEPDEHLKFLLEIIRPKKNKFIEILNKYPSEFSFAIYFNHVNPGISLDKNLLREISELNSEIDFDLYYLNTEK